MDPLSSIISLLRPSTAISKPITGRGSWGARYAAHDAPGFTIILKGSCWLSLEGEQPLRLAEGDFILLPSTPSFTLSSHPDAQCVERQPSNWPVRHGEQDGDPDFASLGGSFSIERANATLLLALMPRLIHVPATQSRSVRLARVIELIMAECAADEPGKDMLLQRLLDVLLIEALRSGAVATNDQGAGLLRGMRDPALGRVLGSMHANVKAPWTVAELAKVAGMSRSAFAARFNETLGCGPIEYLARWRMALAKDALMQGTKKLHRIADEIGYESASAFSNAFRRRLGCSPGRFARTGGVLQPGDRHSI